MMQTYESLTTVKGEQQVCVKWNTEETMGENFPKLRDKVTDSKSAKNLKLDKQKNICI